MATETEIQSLLTFVRYLSWSELMRRSYEIELSRTDAQGLESDSTKWPLFGWLCYAYASLNVVVEAWDGGRFKDPIIDQLLVHSRGYRALLKRFRHAVFHHQRNFTDSRFTDLFREGEEAVLWFMALQDEFKRFAQNRLDNLDGTPDQLMGVRRCLRDLLGWLPAEPEELHDLKETLARATRRMSLHPQEKMFEVHARSLALADIERPYVKSVFCFPAKTELGSSTTSQSDIRGPEPHDRDPSRSSPSLLSRAEEKLPTA